MYKLLTILLALTTALSLSACGTKQVTPDDSAPDGSAPVSSATSTTDEPEDISETPADSSVPPDVSEETPSQSEETDSVQVSLMQEEGENQADDGTLLLEWSYQVPTVSIPSHREAETLIQADLDLLLDDFKDYIATQTQEAAGSYEDGTETFQDSHYSNELQITITRCDDQVISLVLDDIGFAGGVHGWDNRYARNYDATTGERITFDNLGGDRFVDFCRENLLNQIDQQIQQGGEDATMFFDNYQDSIDSIIQDGTSETDYGVVEPSFYFNEQGLVFISGEYMLQPYAAGILEFSIPYADLADIMGDTYLP